MLLLVKLHPLTHPEWVDEYRRLAQEHDAITFVEDFSVSKYTLMADMMISDTSSTVYEMLLLDKPVVTLNTIARDIYWKDIRRPEDLTEAYDSVFDDTELRRRRQWIVANYDPYLDGQVGHRMLEGARDYIRRHGVPRQRRVNLWRKYTGFKTFGSIKSK